MIRFSLSLLFLLVGCGVAAAQDSDGNDTPGNWVTTHFEKYGIWTTACDERTQDGELKQRCYIRYVDVFSTDPKFAAAFMFVFQKDRKTAFQYSFESGTKYNADGLNVQRTDDSIWTAPDACVSGQGCTLSEAAEVTPILDVFKAGGVWVHDFTDRHGQPQVLEWDLKGFDKAYEDYLKQSNARKLLG